MSDTGIMQETISQRQRGFTLIELLTVISIMGILTLIAYPAVREFVASNTQASVINEFIGYLNYTRVEATRRGSQVVICASTDGASCVGTSWEAGWIVYMDSNADGSKSIGEPVLKSRPAVGGTLTIRANGMSSGKVAFNSRGIPTTSKTFRFCDVRGVSNARGVVVSNSGRVKKGTASACP